MMKSASLFSCHSHTFKTHINCVHNKLAAKFFYEDNAVLYKKFITVFLYVVCIFLSSCASNQRTDIYPGHYKIGKPYSLRGHQFVPKDPSELHNFVQYGLASWYGNKDHGKKTANGDIFDKNALTAAHQELPIPSMVKVTNMQNKKSLILMVNDRGPALKTRVIDVSERAAHILGFKNHGVTRVKVEYLPEDSKKLLSELSLEAKHGAKSKTQQSAKKSLKYYLNKINKQ